MKSPGEELLMKLWDTLVEKGIGGLLEPWQTLRVGRAAADVRAYELVKLAEAERDATEIRSGKLEPSQSSYLISSPIQKGESVSEQEHQRLALNIATRSAVADALRKEVNVAKAVIHAENDLRDDPTPPSDKAIDPDWLYRWRDYVGSISSDDLQALWGKVLAGELKTPGNYSFRLLDFLRNLTVEEARLVEAIAPFAIKDFIVREKDVAKPGSALLNEGITFATLLRLQSLGIVSGVDSVGLVKTLSSRVQEKFLELLPCHDKGLLISAEDPKRQFRLEVFVLTELGQQVLRLSKFKANEENLRDVGNRILAMGFDVHLVDCSSVDGKTYQFTNAQSLGQEEKTKSATNEKSSIPTKV